MNRSIKVSDEVYQDLARLQRPRETYSEVVNRLINLYDLIGKASPLLHGAAGLHELERLREKTAATSE